MDKPILQKCTKKMLVIIFLMNILFYQTKIQKKKRIQKLANYLKMRQFLTPDILTSKTESLVFFCLGDI